MSKPEGPSNPRTQNEEVPAPNQQQTADYIASVSLGLSGMAEQAGLPFLKYLLDMTAEEATSGATGPTAPIGSKKPASN
jgi:hypothetical protein